MKYCKVFFALFLLVGMSGATIKSMYVPEFGMYGDPAKIHFDERRKVFVNANIVIDSWMFRMTPQEFASVTKPYDIPAKKKYWVEFTAPKPYRKPSVIYIQAALLGMFQQGKRFLLVNVEESNNPIHFRLYPHLGCLYVGTVADQEGWTVTLWDELIQGYVPLEKLVKPGDVVGLSLVVSGLERGVALAREAKGLGASCVIAGNDSAIFRSDQILSLPGKPIDVVFVSNGLTSVREFFRQYDGTNLGALCIPEVATVPSGNNRSNERSHLIAALKERKRSPQSDVLDHEDVFMIPKFTLYTPEYWNEAWANYETVYGHKHGEARPVKSAIGLLAQGCTRTQGTDACTYCSIFGVGDIRIPPEEYVRNTVNAYKEFGITNFFNATDSAFEMGPLLERLHRVQASFDALTIYGRAQGIALRPELLDQWLALVRDRLLINVGMDSGDERILSRGIVKSSVKAGGSRLLENKAAIRNVQKSGAHLHYSVIFGSPGETVELCERTIEFVEWSCAILGPQLDLVESDIYWLNFGSPASEVFRSYDHAVKLAALAGRTISREEWYRDFAAHGNALVVPWSSEDAWFRHFTGIDLGYAKECNERIRMIMARHEGSIRGRGFNPLRKEA